MYSEWVKFRISEILKNLTGFLFYIAIHVHSCNTVILINTVSEEQCLQQIYIDEQFGDIETRKNEEEKKK